MVPAFSNMRSSELKSLVAAAKRPHGKGESDICLAGSRSRVTGVLSRMASTLPYLGSGTPDARERVPKTRCVRPDGARILTASADNTAKLWDAASGKLIASFGHQGTVRSAAFSPDGAWILTASWDKTAKLWDANTPTDLARQVKQSGDNTARINSSVSMAASSLQVESLSDIASGLQFLNDGSLVAVSEERRSQLTKHLKESVQGLGSNARFIQWFISTGGDRTVFPASNVKVAEWVDNAILTHPNLTEEWLRNALVFLPNHPLLHLALAGFETDSKRADFLRSFGLARLPKNSVVCTRAAEMLLFQHRPELALAAIDKALLADPADVPAQSLRYKIKDAMTR